MSSISSQNDLSMNTRYLWWIWGWIHLKTCIWWVINHNILKSHWLDPTANPSVCDGSGAGSITNSPLIFFFIFCDSLPGFDPLMSMPHPIFFDFWVLRCKFKSWTVLTKLQKRCARSSKRKKNGFLIDVNFLWWQLGSSTVLREIAIQAWSQQSTKPISSFPSTHQWQPWEAAHTHTHDRFIDSILKSFQPQVTKSSIKK